MSILLEHARLVTKMYKNKMNMGLLREFTEEEIDNCCNRMAENTTLNNGHKESEIIQRELVRDEHSIRYITDAYQKEVDMRRFETLIKEITGHQEKMTEYPLRDIYNVINNIELNDVACYDYLKYFSNNDILKKKITNNLNHFYTQDYIKFEELNEAERELFKEMYLDNYNLLPTHDNVKRIYELLSKNKELRNLIKFLKDRKLYIPLNIQSYEHINNNANEILHHINVIAAIIVNDEIMYKLLLRWLENGCNVYELEVIKQPIKNVGIEELKNVFNTRSSYINFIYGNKLKKFPLESITTRREELIIYAISNNKNSFLNLIEKNMNEFLSIPTSSILYREEFYSKFINLNELSLKNLIKLQTMYFYDFIKIFELKEQRYTFEEISTLYNVEEQYIYLYNQLLDLKIDDRLIRIKQLIKKQLLDNVMDKDEIGKIADKIKIKPLYMWIDCDFNRIKGIKPSDVIKIFISYDSINRFIPEIKNTTELSYIIRNIDEIQDYDSLEKVKEDIQIIDAYWNKLKIDLNFSKEFIEKYDQNIKQFILSNGAEIAYKYYINCNAEQKESFRLIIKAELMGEFKKLKYHTNDLQEEIDYKLNSEQIDEWTKNNNMISESEYDVAEYDDFYHTMILGECPQHTCLSYINGMYNRCLLACFDSNKKILYAKVNGEIVARAMVRLTKVAYNRNIKKTMSFIDVENNSKKDIEEDKEKLTLFLEKIYMAGIRESEKKCITKIFIKLLEKKAEKMNATLVLSNYYEDCVGEEYIKTRYYMYISKSKSSAQYLDSLEGQATVTNEGEYKVNNFLVWRPNKNIELGGNKI